jgi:menaquinol-cytochrome c reductase iron-sulfur subunit
MTPPQLPRVPRRNFILRIGAGLSALATALVAVPIVGYLLSPLRGHFARAWIRIGAIDDFPVGETRFATFESPFRNSWDGPTSDVPCYVRRPAVDQYQVFAINCTHLGCPVRWFPESSLFMCPCHGGVYYGDGSRASGPPPRGLFQYEHQVKNGQLWVRGGALPTLATPAS